MIISTTTNNTKSIANILLHYYTQYIQSKYTGIVEYNKRSWDQVKKQDKINCQYWPLYLMVTRYRYKH